MGCRVTVPIAQCVHYGGFRYGHMEDHPYETFTQMCSKGDGKGAREWLIEFVSHYRPKHLGEALGLGLDREYPLWSYPWVRADPSGSGWFDDPGSPPDIITFFSEAGILWFRIEEEFVWLERTLYSIREKGYVLSRSNGIVARKLLGSDGSEAFLILDGNHRLSALSALGQTTVELTFLPVSVIKESDVEKWPKVRRGQYTRSDAKRVFQAYFAGNMKWKTSSPAKIIGRP